jgi:hypothetical protein
MNRKFLIVIYLISSKKYDGDPVAQIISKDPAYRLFKLTTESIQIQNTEKKTSIKNSDVV